MTTSPSSKLKIYSKENHEYDLMISEEEGIKILSLHSSDNDIWTQSFKNTKLLELHDDGFGIKLLSNPVSLDYSETLQLSLLLNAYKHLCMSEEGFFLVSEQVLTTI